MNETITKPRILTDSEVYQSGEGYERTVLYSGWDRTNLRRIAQVHIRVDRVPGSSFAYGSIWTVNGWQQLVSEPSVLFWSSMPGYLRWTNDTSDKQTIQLAEDLLVDLANIVEDADI